MTDPTPLRYLMIERSAHVKHLRDRVEHADYAVNPRAVADAMLRQAALRAQWRRGISGYRRCS